LNWTIEFDPTAQKSLRRIDRAWQRRIVAYLDEIAQLPDPRVRGKALSGNLTGLWRYRVGDYRIVCQHRDQHMTVYVVKIGHRREVYDR